MPLMQIKSSVLVFITLSVRATIRGGLTPEYVYSTGDKYIGLISECDSVSELAKLATTHIIYQRNLKKKQEKQLKNILILKR